MFTLRGLIEDEGRGEVSISWYAPGERREAPGIVERGLSGDRDLIVRAVIDEALGRYFSATPEGPTFVANLDEAKAAVVQLSSYFRPRYRVDGSPPVIEYEPLPPGAVA